ncbi:MAG: nuclear transport factor 2 family protein [Sulfuricaulis sp.]|nr:nuclear transport factor 2 family protein [Sulfuricaulis sp.]
MEKEDPYSPARIADRMKIQDALYRWCRSVDRLDYKGMREAFHPDGMDNHGIFNGSADGLVEWIRDRHKNIPFSMHSISNILIEFAGPDLALVETYIRTVQRYPADAMASLAQLSGGKVGTSEFGSDLMTCSRYLDRFERRSGEWRIHRRTVIQDWKQMVDVAPNAPQPLPGWTVGRRDSEDPVFKARRELGLESV